MASSSARSQPPPPQTPGAAPAAPPLPAPTVAIASVVPSDQPDDLPANIYSQSPSIDIAVISFPWENLAIVCLCALVAMYNFSVMMHNQNVEQLVKDHPDQYEIRNDGRNSARVGGLTPLGWMTMLLSGITAIGGLFSLAKTTVTIDKAAQCIRINKWAIPCVCLSQSGEYPFNSLHPSNFKTSYATRGQKVRFTVFLCDTDRGDVILQRSSWIDRRMLAGCEAYGCWLRQIWLNYLSTLRRNRAAAEAVPVTASPTRGVELHFAPVTTGVVVGGNNSLSSLSTVTRRDEIVAVERPTTLAGVAVDRETRQLLMSGDHDDEELDEI